jgi:hypothetical protein
LQVKLPWQYYLLYVSGAVLLCFTVAYALEGNIAHGVIAGVLFVLAFGGAVSQHRRGLRLTDRKDQN